MTLTVTTPTPGDLVHVEPGSLIVGANVRTDVQADAAQFAKSIRTLGVLTPITAYVDPDGALVVVAGQRRTVVATQQGTPQGTVPVYVVAAPGEEERISSQMVENIHRASMHETEVAAGVEQLSLLGVSAAQITKRTALPRARVDAALAVAGSTTARERLEKGATLAEAAVWAEFDGDEEALTRLEREVRWGHDAVHVAARIRQDRAEEALLAAERERLTAEGLPVLTPENVPQDTHSLMMENLVDGDDQAVPEELWPQVPGAAVRVHLDHPWDSETGERKTVVAHTWLCLNPRAAGLRYRYGSAPTAPQSSEDRREVRENNAAWRAAETVRRDWLRSLARRKAVPAGAEALIVAGLAGTGRTRTAQAMERGHRLLGEFLHGEKAYGADLTAGTAAPKAATVRALMVVLAAWEESSGVHTWRNPGEWDRQVLRALGKWGYTLSPIEQTVIDSE